MLRLWCLNVGHGDSTVVQFRTNTGDVFGVIDSNRVGDSKPKALTKLRELGAEELSFVALTHPHADHYSGMLEILQAYAGRIQNFYSFPIGHQLHGRKQLRKLAETYQKLVEKTDSAIVHKQAEEFVGILLWVKQDIGIDNWLEVTGPSASLLAPGFQNVDVTALLPFAKVKGDYFRMIKEGNIGAAQEKESLNELSLAIQFRYSDVEIIVGGDSTIKGWRDHSRHMANGGYALSSSVVRLPHHGSKYDNTEMTLDHWYSNDDDVSRYAVISANGQSHPHNQTYAHLEDRSILPYCTNLAMQCGGVLSAMISMPEVNPELRRWINSLGEDLASSSQTCQGDVLVEINDTSEVVVTPEYDHPCPYRGVLKDLFA